MKLKLSDSVFICESINIIIRKNHFLWPPEASHDLDLNSEEDAAAAAGTLLLSFTIIIIITPFITIIIILRPSVWAEPQSWPFSKSQVMSLL